VCDEAVNSTCEQLNCGDEEWVRRTRLSKSGANGAANEVTSYESKVHFGLVASGDVVMKSGEDRDHIAGKEKVIAFEMEGAGVWDTLPCLIIKGVCDYADSHKSKRWQNYAATSAAACMKAFLENWITNDTSISM
jgi:nucleoside phosphorylase